MLLNSTVRRNIDTTVLSSVMWTCSTSPICRVGDKSKGGSRRVAVIGTCYQSFSWLRLGLPHLWQGFPAQKYVCRHHPDGLHMHWKCIPSSACLMCCACAVQLCTHSQSDGSSTHCAYAVICTVYKLSREAHMAHVHNVRFLVAFGLLTS